MDCGGKKGLKATAAEQVAANVAEDPRGLRGERSAGLCRGCWTTALLDGSVGGVILVDGNGTTARRTLGRSAAARTARRRPHRRRLVLPILVGATLALRRSKEVAAKRAGRSGGRRRRGRELANLLIGEARAGQHADLDQTHAPSGGGGRNIHAAVITGWVGAVGEILVRRKVLIIHGVVHISGATAEGDLILLFLATILGGYII